MTFSASGEIYNIRTIVAHGAWRRKSSSGVEGRALVGVWALSTPKAGAVCRHPV